VDALKPDRPKSVLKKVGKTPDLYCRISTRPDFSAFIPYFRKIFAVSIVCLFSIKNDQPISELVTLWWSGEMVGNTKCVALKSGISEEFDHVMHFSESDLETYRPQWKILVLFSLQLELGMEVKPLCWTRKWS